MIDQAFAAVLLVIFMFVFVAVCLGFAILCHKPTGFKAIPGDYRAVKFTDFDEFIGVAGPGPQGGYELTFGDQVIRLNAAEWDCLKTKILHTVG